jgi:V/A-type H+-transporting ATPase subunit C
MERRLVEDGILQRIIDSEDIEGALKILSETSYSSGINDMKSSSDFDSLIESELLNCYEEVSSFVPDSGLIALCRLPYDFHNVKALIKNLIQVRDGGERSYRLLSKLGSIPIDGLILAIEGEDYKLLPHSLDLVIPKCLLIWEQTRDLQEVERILDDALFNVMNDKARVLNMPHVSEWVRIKIDSENLRTLYRLKRLGVDAAEALKFIHNGGSISPERFIQIISEPVEGWGRFLSSSNLSSAFSSSQESTDIENAIIDMERVLDEFSVKVLMSAKYDAFSPSNVLLYIFTKENEAKNLRIALVSVANGTDKDLARRLMRHVR